MKERFSDLVIKARHWWHTWITGYCNPMCFDPDYATGKCMYCGTPRNGMEDIP